jgi:hypothetical protein
MRKPESRTRSGPAAAVTFGLFCAVIVVGSAVRGAGELDDRRGILVFLLVMVAPVFIATGVSITLWRLMLRLLPASVGIPERLLFTLAGFVTTCGSGPLAIGLAIMAITRQEDPMGAAGIWALSSIVVGSALCVFGITITIGRLMLYGRRSKPTATLPN